MRTRAGWGLAVLVALLSLPIPSARADVFDRYTNNVLGKVAGAEGVQTPARLTPQLISESGKLLPGSSSALLVVKTNGGRFSKLAVQIARQRTTSGAVPIALIERFVTFKEGEDRALQATGGPIHLYNGFQLNLDLGQVVPAEVGGDLKFVSADGENWLEPVGMAKMFLLTKPLPGTEGKKFARPMIGESFEPRYFSGTYKLVDDGRRAARLVLNVDDEGIVTGEYTSESSGRAYEVYGKVANPKHQIHFTVKFPQTEQQFTGWMFTNEGKYITGSTRMQEREFGWYAVRQDDE
jgi:hypothetical protein